MPPCSLISSMRSSMPMRACLPKPAIGPERSWIVPSTTSFLLTPCDWAKAGNGIASASAAASAKRFMVMSPGLLTVKGFDPFGVLFLDQLALELHRRRQLFVFRAELVLEQEELLHLLDARELLVDAVDLRLDQFLDFARARQAGVVAERHVVVLRELLDVLLVDHHDQGQVRAPVADHH